MPKAGKYTYPLYNLDFAIEKLKRAYDIIRSREMSRSVIADVLGMSEKGGAFTYLLSAWEDYGLTINREGKVILTELGERILAGDENAKSEAVTRIELFKDIYKTYGRDPKVEQIEAFLKQKALLSPLKAKKLSSQVFKIYISVSKYIRPEITPFRPLEEKAIKGVEQKMLPETKSNVLIIQYGEVYIRIPKGDKEAIKLAKAALDFIEKYEEEQSYS